MAAAQALAPAPAPCQDTQSGNALQKRLSRLARVGSWSPKRLQMWVLKALPLATFINGASAHYAMNNPPSVRTAAPTLPAPLSIIEAPIGAAHTAALVSAVSRGVVRSCPERPSARAPSARRPPERVGARAYARSPPYSG